MSDLQRSRVPTWPRQLPPPGPSLTLRRPFRAAFLAAAATTVYGAVTGRDKLQWIAKPLMMPLLAADVATDRAALDPVDRTVLLGCVSK
ncbi:hypothetical protein [Nocardia sp. NPDC004604]|uniref:hypothetical protein n=1 Tax=Nocardia sp. NPDC004604 TaxID=3157013 RepID=UPI0033B456C5